MGSSAKSAEIFNRCFLLHPFRTAPPLLGIVFCPYPIKAREDKTSKPIIPSVIVRYFYLDSHLPNHQQSVSDNFACYTSSLLLLNEWNSVGTSNILNSSLRKRNTSLGNNAFRYLWSCCSLSRVCSAESEDFCPSNTTSSRTW